MAAVPGDIELPRHGGYIPRLREWRPTCEPSALGLVALAAYQSASTHTHFVGRAALDLYRTLTVHVHRAVPWCAAMFRSGPPQRWRRECRCPHLVEQHGYSSRTYSTRRFNPLVVRQHLPAHDPLAVGRWVARAARTLPRPRAARWWSWLQRDLRRAFTHSPRRCAPVPWPTFTAAASRSGRQLRRRAAHHRPSPLVVDGDCDALALTLPTCRVVGQRSAARRVPGLITPERIPVAIEGHAIVQQRRPGRESLGLGRGRSAAILPAGSTRRSGFQLRTPAYSRFSVETIVSRWSRVFKDCWQGILPVAGHHK